jgi:hypothetical protein
VRRLAGSAPALLSQDATGRLDLLRGSQILTLAADDIANAESVPFSFVE